MIVEIQCLPSPMGNANNKYGYVEAAIELIEQCGLRYEVGPLGTSIEGESDEIWPLIRLVHEECLNAGADGVVSVIKVAQRAGDSPATIDSLVDKYRAVEHK